MLWLVKDLKQNWPRVYFRLEEGSIAKFRTACEHFGTYQRVLASFAEYFTSVSPGERDSLMRMMASFGVHRTPQDEPTPLKHRLPTPVERPVSDDDIEEIGKVGDAPRPKRRVGSKAKGQHRPTRDARGGR